MVLAFRLLACTTLHRHIVRRIWGSTRPPFCRYLSDLTFIEQGSADFLPLGESDDPGQEPRVVSKLINFGKCRLSGKTIAEIHQFQSEVYNLQVRVLVTR